MALQLELDYALQKVIEPGYFQRLPSDTLEKVLNPGNAAGYSGFWSDEATRTLMLQPLQLRSGWRDSAAQLSSIIGLTDRGSGKLQTNAANISAFSLFEADLKQNLSNPFVFFKANTGGLAALLALMSLIALNAKAGFPINTTDARVIAYTEETIPGNQAMYFRWFAPDAQASPGSIMGICLGQFTLVFTNDMLEVFEDISTDRSRGEWRRLMSAPLFSAGSAGFGSNQAAGGRSTSSETAAQERSILWLPYHRNLIYIQASSGKWAVIDARTEPRLNGAATDWDIVDDRQILVWGYSTSVGHFQLQKVKWHDTAQFLLPSFTIDYSPATPLNAANLIDDADAYRGTALTHGTPATPPGYDNYVNTLETCPAVTTDGTAQTRTYGATYTLTSDGANRFTPMLYGVQVRIPRAVGTWPVSPSTLVGDTAATDARIVKAEISSSLARGEKAGLNVEVIDESPFALAALWYRSSYPVRLTETVGAVNYFTGISDPTTVAPPHFATNRPRRLHMKAVSLWKLLDTKTPLRDQRDWTGTGHISVVDFIVGQAGVDTTGADYPPLADWNQPLGGLATQIPNMGSLTPHWQPTATDTAATFITRIAEQFSGFKVGFYPSGQFYYLPADPVWYYNASETTFFKSRQTNPAGPCYEDPVEFEPVECEANVVQVVAKAPTGGTLRSALFVDWASILNTAAPNFLGRWRMEIFPVNGTLTCGEVNRIARTLFQQTRRRHLRVHFMADYVPSLKVGRVCTLEGQPGTYRILEYTGEFTKTDIRQAVYTAELVEAGYAT